MLGVTLITARLSEVDVHMAQAFLAYPVLQFRPAEQVDPIIWGPGVMYLVNIHILYQIFF